MTKKVDGTGETSQVGETSHLHLVFTPRNHCFRGVKTGLVCSKPHQFILNNMFCVKDSDAIHFQNIVVVLIQVLAMFGQSGHSSHIASAGLS